MEPPSSSTACVVAITAETAAHNPYLSLPLKTATVQPGTPNKAYDQVERQQPAIILLDCGLEVEKGLRMLRELKESHPHVPIIFLTDSKSYDTVVRAHRTGARHFVGKPANLFELGDTVEKILKITKDCKEARSPLTMARSSDRELLKGITFDKPAPILRAIRYIEDNLSKTITLDLLAGAAGLSKYHFSRIFYRHAKMTPIHFVARMRIENAKGLLKTDDLNISEVGQHVGFNNLSSFIRQFRNSTGITPSAYRKYAATVEFPASRPAPA
jgi:AraC family transcriptional regulator